MALHHPIPYNPLTDRYEIEIWGYLGTELRTKLDARGKAAMYRGGLIVNAGIAQSNYSDFAREGLDNRDMRTVAATNIMHPVLPLNIQVAWADKTETWWDSRDGQNYHYQFNMIYREDSFLQVGFSESPHGGVGFLHYRNLLSNYFAFSDSGELGRDVEPWSFDANGVKSPVLWHEKVFLDGIHGSAYSQTGMRDRNSSPSGQSGDFLRAQGRGRDGDRRLVPIPHA